jgi:riboflavin-specific deaminase-like protein
MKAKVIRPKITLKFAQTLDGKIATRTGDSKWISSLPSRRLAHRLRSRHDAVLVGVNTVLKDDPLLDVRLVKGKSPTKVILDSKLRTPLTARLLQGKRASDTIIAVTKKCPIKRIAQFQKTGVKILPVKADQKGRVDLRLLLPELRQLGIESVLVEGGGKIIASFLKFHLVDRLIVILAPKILGEGTESLGETNRKAWSNFHLTKIRMFSLGKEIVVEGWLCAK